MREFRVTFQYTRTVTTLIRAEAEEEIHDFLEAQGEDWNVLDYAPDVIVDDLSEPDYEFTDLGDYRVEALEEQSREARYEVIGGELMEIGV